VVQQHVALADGGEDVRLGGGLHVGEAARGAGHERRYFSSGVQAGDGEQPGQVQRPGQRVDLGLGDVQLADQQVEDVGSMDSSTSRRTGGPKRRRISSFSSA